MSRCLDTSSTTQMAQIMVKHWRSSGTSRTTFAWAPTRRMIVGKTVWRNSVGSWMGKSTELGMSRIMLIGKHGWRQHGRKEAQYGSHVEEIEEHWSWWASIISWPRVFGMYSTWMQTAWNCCWGIYKGVWIKYLCWEQLENYQGGRSFTQTLSRGPDMRNSALRVTVNWQTKKTEQLHKVSSFCLDDHHFKKEELESVGELSKSMLTNGLEMRVLGTNWWAWHSLVSEHTCSFSHAMNRSVWPTFSSLDFIHSSHKWLPTMLSCG